MKEKLKPEARSRSVPDICITPRTRKKLLQIEHPHFDKVDVLSNISCTDVSQTLKSDSERFSQDLDKVFSTYRSDRTETSYSSPSKTENGGLHLMGGSKDEVECFRSEGYPRVKNAVMTNEAKSESFGAKLVNNAIGMNEINKNDFKQRLIDQNANPWKATTLV